MKTVKLYGHLGKMFGKKHVLNVRDSYDAIRALSANFPNFKHEFAKQGRCYMVAINKHLVTDKDELLLPAHEIKFIPVVGGAGGGIGQILIGAALITAAVFMPEILLAADIALSATATSLIAGAAFSFGATLVLGGVSQMLSKNPQAQTQAQQDSKNYAFSGPVNTTSQGNPVPVLYGRMIIGSQVISASIRSGDIPIANETQVVNNVVNYKGQY